jgi:hypothetical protein
MMVLEIGDAPYQEFSEQGVPEEKLLSELKGEIQDELDEYDLEGLLKQMLSSDYHKNSIASLQRKKARRMFPGFCWSVVRCHENLFSREDTLRNAKMNMEEWTMTFFFASLRAPSQLCLIIFRHHAKTMYRWGLILGFKHWQHCPLEKPGRIRES